jgi:hypothetical protein
MFENGIRYFIQEIFDREKLHAYLPKTNNCHTETILFQIIAMKAKKVIFGC